MVKIHQDGEDGAAPEGVDIVGRCRQVELSSVQARLRKQKNGGQVLIHKETEAAGLVFLFLFFLSLS